MSQPTRTGSIAWAATILVAALVVMGLAGRVSVVTTGLCLVGAVLMLAAWRREGLRRPGWLLLAIPLLLLAAWFAAQPVVVDDVAAWERSQKDHLNEVVTRTGLSAEQLRQELEVLAARAVDDDSESDGAHLTNLAAGWTPTFGAGYSFPLALALWRHGERVAWRGDLEPFPDDDLPAAEESDQVRRGRAGWVWRGSTPSARGVLEWQIHLTSPGSSPSVADAELRTSVVFTSEPNPTRWFGDAQRGLRASFDVVLDPAPGDMELPVLRSTISGRPLSGEVERRDARRRLIFALLLGFVLPAWTASILRPGFVLGTAWIVRCAWAVTDLFHLLPSTGFGGEGPSRPGELGSLVDPTYFASSWGLGLFSSTLDAALTGTLISITAVMAARRLHPQQKNSRAEPGLGMEIVYGLGAAVVLALLWDLAGELAVNAHPRLIGPRTPFRAVTFWGLHLVLLTTGGGAFLLAAVLAGRRRGSRGPQRLLIALVAALIGGWAVRGFGLGLGLVGLVGLPIVVFVVRVTSGLVMGSDRALRRLAWLLPLFAAVTWNYLGLSHAYRGVEGRWLERKLEEMTEPREDWIQFLMEDLLAEMAADEAVLQDAPAAHAPEAAELWRDWPAYALWRGAGVADLGMPCLVEILDSEGQGSSRFASGQFRDFGYELVQRSEWTRGRPVSPRPDLKLDLYLQHEQRRYATGDEWVLRGEVTRLGTEGWIALELPIRTGRVRTMREAIAPSSWENNSGDYAPRQDVDRPVMLLRAEDGEWWGQSGDQTPKATAREVAASLRSAGPGPANQRFEGASWRCLWGPLPDQDGEDDGILIGVEEPGLGDRLLDLSRLILLDLLLLAVLSLLPLTARLATGGWRGARLGLQERFLALSFLLGMLPLLMAGTFIDRINREWLTEDARAETREGLETAREQLQGLLAEQARALAGSDYISELLASRLAGDRPLGPFAARQAMVFSADGELLLDETLSDLDRDEAALLLERARASSLVVMRDDASTYLGTVIPVDLESGPELSELEGRVGNASGPGTRRRDGFFFYRQRLDADLLAGLAEVIQGEATLYIEGEALLSSHPDHVFSGRTELILPPERAAGLDMRGSGLHVVADPGHDLSWTGLLTLPVLRNTPGTQNLVLGEIPAVLAASFPARGRDYTAQRERTVLFLAGLATMIFLLATVLGVTLAWRIFDPVRVLVTATRRLAAGDYDAPLPPPAADELGTLSAAFGAMRDDLRLARTSLEEREQFLARLLERVPVGVAVFGREDCLVTLNPAARSMVDLFYAETAAATEDRARLLLHEFLRVTSARGGEAELSTPTGGRTLRGRMAPLVLPDGGQDRMIVFEDVTEFLETKSLAINAQLARQVAHEVKNPLTPIQLSVQFLQQAWKDQAENMDEILTATVAQVLEQVELLRRIATEFSLLGRPEELVCESLDPAALVDDVLKRYRTPDGGFEVRNDDPAPPAVLAHAESLAKVVANLMENSLQAVGAGGDLVLELTWRVKSDSVTMIWRDNGSGIPRDVADRLFDLYFSTKSHGTGLGLPICRNLLSRMGAQITLGNRTDGSGAEATLVLRRAPGNGEDA